MRILVTGGCGFLGHHVVDHFLRNSDATIVVLDKLTYAANGYDRLRDSAVFDDGRVAVLAADFREALSPGVCQEIGAVDYILHLGGETHVDRSIADCTPFTLSNVLGTQRVLDYARTVPSLKLMLYASTDEVYGVAPPGVNYREGDPLDPRNPYAATKAAAEMLCLAYAHTHGVPVAVTRTMNLVGERQHPEKLVPLVIRKVLAGHTVLIHSSPDKTRAGSRFYLHCRNWATAADFLLTRAVPRECYNVVGEQEVDNLAMAEFIAATLGEPLHYEMVDFHSSRPGHDLRYALDGGKLAAMGWTPPVGFWESLRATVLWYVRNPRWLEWSTP